MIELLRPFFHSIVPVGGALAMAEDLYSDQKTFGISDEDELSPYTIYIVGTDGSFTQDSAL